jgi:hypothetical protein
LLMRGKRLVRIPTPSYNAWHTSALKQLEALGYDPDFKARRKLQPQLRGKITEPINLECHFYLKSNGRVDLSALYEGIQDVLVEVGLLDDDNFKIVASHDGSGVEVDKERPRIEVVIRPKSEMWER